MNITPEDSLKIIVSLLNRTPMTEAERVGAQLATNELDNLIKESTQSKDAQKPST